MEDLLSYLDRFTKTRVLVVGDVMVDRYLWGKVSRISPEAPVPVVDVTNESVRLGGAANVFNNIRALEGQAALCGVIGADPCGHWLAEEVKRCGAETDGLLTEKERPTIEKTRIVAHSQQVVRFDRESRQPIAPETQRKIFEFSRSRIESPSEKCDCLVLSDYAKGVLNPGLIKDLLNLARKQSVRIIVDPKVCHINDYRGVTLLSVTTLTTLGL